MSFSGRSASSRVLSESSTELETLRPITVRFDLKGWGPGEGMGVVTFDGLAVEPAPLAGGTLLANAQGELAGTFVVPEGVPAGARVVNFTGPLGSRGSQTFMGQGTAILRTQQQVTTESWSLSYPAPISTGGAVFGPSGTGSTPTQNQSACSRWLYEGYFDPLAQTFVLDELTQCAGVDLPFTAKGGPVVVQIRETFNGVPTQAVVIEARVAADAIALDGFTRITWAPTLLQARREYAIVVLCDDATTAVAVAELGKQDPVQGYVTSQPYQVGVLLSSSNASTWTPHQDRDLCFRLLGAQYTQTERVIELGTADLVNATDLMVLGFAERPSAAANLLFEVQFPEAMGSEVVRLTDGQVVWLAAPFTGQVQVRARISGDARLAAVLQNGVQLVAGNIQGTGTYISRTVAADADNTVKVVYEGDIPGGSAVTVHVQGTAPGAPWVLVPYLSASTNTAGVREITHELQNFNAGDGARVRLTLTGSTTARPQQLVELALADKAEGTELDALALSTANALATKASTASVNALAQSTSDALALKASADALANAVATLNAAIATKAASTTPTITGLREVRVALGAGTQIDVAAGNLFTKTIAGATVLTVANVPPAGTVACFLLDLTNGGSAAITWWAGCKWPGGVAPLLTAAGRDLLGFVTHDGGATWTGTRLAKDAKAAEKRQHDDHREEHVAHQSGARSAAGGKACTPATAAPGQEGALRGHTHGVPALRCPVRDPPRQQGEHDDAQAGFQLHERGVRRELRGDDRVHQDAERACAAQPEREHPAVSACAARDAACAAGQLARGGPRAHHAHRAHHRRPVCRGRQHVIDGTSAAE
ncbi:hypothetical protein OSTOST_13181 [Ostertagia ostertagi]